MARHRQNGSLDPAFGDGDGWAAIPSGASSTAGMVVQDDGRIVVGGRAGGSGVVLRLTADGEPDPTFGNGGSVEVPGFVDDVAVLADGRVVAAGSAADGTRRATLVALLPDGSRDTAFGDGGVAGVDPYGLGAAFRALAPRGAGVVATGWAAINENGDDVIVAAFDADGRLDPAFGGDGVAAEALGSGYSDRGVDVDVQPDGRVVVVADDSGWQSPQAAVLRFRPSGRLDRSFGGTGVVHTAVGHSTSWVAADLRGGRAVLAGTSWEFSLDKYFVVERVVL